MSYRDHQPGDGKGRKRIFNYRPGNKSIEQERSNKVHGLSGLAAHYCQCGGLSNDPPKVSTS